eukprot:NODE_37_length_31305_cov_0.348939.p4 type:complete len:765 gc:universal NODE_37_length_31305_cov_0.348939:2814-5108(+)
MLLISLLAFADQLQFTADHSKLMKTLVDSLYKNKEIFLRELLSNSADALDKYKLTALRDHSSDSDVSSLEIKVIPDKERGVLEIIDNGVGMSMQELIDNLGTISKSGTSEFQAEHANDKDLIGQFGVGFYSSFLVADRVDVISAKDNQQSLWTSDYSKGNGYTVEKDTKHEPLGRGTRIILHLRDSAKSFLEQKELEELIGKYTQFISFPIKLRGEIKKDDVDEDEDEVEEVDMDEDKDGKREEKKDMKESKETVKWTQINANKPLWTMKESELSFEDYSEFYKKAFKQYEEPLHYIHFKASAGVNDFNALLFIPKTPALPTAVGSAKNNKIKVYVRRVFITDNLEDFLPNYLSFISGIIDADDFPLNVARETLQQSSTITAVKSSIKSKIIKSFIQLSSNDPELYNTKFWPAYGGSIKLGIIEDSDSKTKLAPLLRFRTSWYDVEQDVGDTLDEEVKGNVLKGANSEDDDEDDTPSQESLKWEKESSLTSFDSYISRMKKDQKDIYYLCGESITEIKRSPYIESLINNGFEVLYLPDVHDEYLMQQFKEYKKGETEYKLTSATKYEEKEDEDLVEQFSPLTVFLTSHFEKYVDKVVISTRLTTSPGALIAGATGVSGNMERILKSQLNNMGSSVKDQKNSGNWQLDMALKSKKIWEINPYHPLINGLLQKVIYLEDTFDASQPESIVKARNRDVLRICALLYDSISVRSGYGLRDALRFGKRLDKILSKELGVDSDKMLKPEKKEKKESEEIEQDENEEKEEL